MLVAGNADLARENFSLAAAYFEALLEKYPEDSHAHGKLGLAYAGLGKKQLAMEHGQKSLELVTQNFSAFDYPFILYGLVQTSTLCGEYDSALTSLNELLATHSLYTLDFIKTDPDLKPLLDEPGFKDLNP